MANGKKQRIAGWVLSVLVAVFLIGISATGKFTEWEGKAKMFEHLGYRQEVIFYIGIVEVALGVLFLVPRGGFLGAILLTGYLGGAIATHVRVGDPFWFPIVLGVLMWVALGLRQSIIFTLAQGKLTKHE